MVEQRVTAKAEKHYHKCDGLIIFSNAFPIEREEALNADWWSNAAGAARSKFAEVWVHKSGKFSRIF